MQFERIEASFRATRDIFAAVEQAISKVQTPARSNWVHLASARFERRKQLEQEYRQLLL
jgi:hypothetical protein